MKEIWKDVVGYEGLYRVSNLGRVKNNRRPHILHIYVNNWGYCCVSLWKNNKDHKHLVHRLVAQAFISNTFNLPLVNHKDENKTNNSIDNLEWCTSSYNNTYGSRPDNIRKHRKYSCYKRLEDGKVFKGVEEVYLDNLKNHKIQCKFRSFRTYLVQSIKLKQSFYGNHYIKLS